MLVAGYCHNPHHTFAWENTAIKASALGRVSREIVEAWLFGTRSLNHHVDLHAAYRRLRNHQQPPTAGVKVKLDTQTRGSHETCDTEHPNQKQIHPPTPLSVLNLSQTSC